MAFLSAGRETYTLKVPTERVVGGRRVTVKRSTETDDQAQAEAMGTMVKALVETHHAWDVLARVSAGTLTVRTLYREWCLAAQRLEPLRAALALVAPAPAVDVVAPPVVLLKDLVDAWATSMRSTARNLARDTAQKYEMAVRCFVDDDDALPLSAYSTLALREHLDTLAVTPSTVRKHGAGLSDFGRWLVEREKLEHNPMDAIKLPKQGKPRDKYLSTEQLRRLADAKTPEYRDLDYVMASTSADLSTALEMVRGDIDLKAMVATLRGTKHSNRVRSVNIATFAHEQIRALCQGLKPHVPLFPTITDRWTAAEYHRVVCQQLVAQDPVFSGYWLRDHRHSFGVRLAKAGTPLQVIAEQMGNTLQMAVLVYTKHLPTTQERAFWEKAAAKLDRAAATVPTLRTTAAQARDPERDPQNAVL